MDGILSPEDEDQADGAVYKVGSLRADLRGRHAA